MTQPIEKVDEETKGRRGGKREGSGRKKGTPNKVTSDARSLFVAVVEKNAKRMKKWFDALDKKAKDDPAKAITTFLHASEFVLPKLARTELANSDTGELVVRVVRG